MKAQQGLVFMSLRRLRYNLRAVVAVKRAISDELVQKGLGFGKKPFSRRLTAPC